MSERQRVSVPDSRAQRTTLPAGSVVGEYTLTFHAFGGMSVVYRGVKGDQVFLVKEVPADNPVQVLALTQERSMLERLKHPGIVKFETLFVEDGFYYLVCEFITGVELEERVEKGAPATEAEVRDWGLQLCDIFVYLHGLTPPIIYRDLKPANLLLSDGRLRLVDFGIARVFKGERSTDTEALGTFCTVSPEHYGGSQTDPRSDVFTLGATLYDLLTRGTRRNFLPSMHPPVRTINPEVTAELEGILSKCLAVSPDDRYQTMEELRDALQGAAAPRPVALRPRRGRLTPWLALLLLVGLAVAALTASRGHAPPSAAHAHEEGPTEDTGLEGDVFGTHAQGPDYVVTLGEELGLFRVSQQGEDSARQRAEKLAERLNRLYHEQCPTCGVFRLEPAGFRIGRSEQAPDQVALFYCHEEPPTQAGGARIMRTPVLLTLVDEKQAGTVGSSPKFAAGYWRDLTRDLIEISRNREADDTPLGRELNQELLSARRRLGEHASASNLREVLSELSNERSTRLRTLFERVPPDYRCRVDVFNPVQGYTPLKG